MAEDLGLIINYKNKTTNDTIIGLSRVSFRCYILAVYEPWAINLFKKFKKFF